MTLTPAERCVTDANEEWANANDRERLGLIDPDGERELLAEFLDWLDGKLDAGGRITLYDVARHVAHQWIATQGERWISYRITELQESREGDCP